MLCKKWLALSLVLLLFLGMFTGCSPVEIKFYQLYKEISDLDIYSFTGSIELSLEQLPAAISQGGPAITEDMIKQFLNSSRIDYQGKVDYVQGVMHYELTIANKITGEKSDLTTIIINEDTIYFKIDDLLGLIKKFGSAEDNQKLDMVFAGVEYVSINAQDFQSMMPPGSSLAWKNNILLDSRDQQKLFFDLIDALINGVYDKYQGSQITKDGDKYIMTLKLAELGDIVGPAAVYTINNIDKLGEVLRSYLNNLNDDDIAMLGLTPEIKQQGLQGIELMVADVNQNREKYLAQIDGVMSSSKDQLAGMFGDSYIAYDIEKKGSGTYDLNTVIHLNITAGQPVETLKCSFTMKQTIETGGPVQVAVPAGAITCQELEKRVPVRLNINIDQKTYHKDMLIGGTAGILDLKIIEDSTYLPLRQTAALLDKTVGWNNELRQAYIEHNGEQVYIAGRLIDGVTYIKARELERFGFNVAWNEAARTVIIEKQ